MASSSVQPFLHSSLQAVAVHSLGHRLYALSAVTSRLSLLHSVGW